MSVRGRAALLVGISLIASSARADVLGPVEPRTDCPVGARSAELGGGHGHFAACVPNLAREDWACVDGRRIDVVGLVLSSRHIGPAWDGRRGPMPPEMRTLGSDVVIVESGCDAPSDGPIVESTIARGTGTASGFGGPSADGVAMGCQRVRVWVDDAEFACAPPPLPPPSTTAPPPPPPPSPRCGCGIAQRSHPIALALLALLVGARARRRSRTGSDPSRDARVARTCGSHVPALPRGPHRGASRER